MKSKIAYSTDNWTTKQMVFTFAGTMASFINDEWEICERLVDFHHIEDKEHEGIYMLQRHSSKQLRVVGVYIK